MRSQILFLLTTILMAVQDLKLPTYSTCNPSVATVTAARGRITSPNFPSHYTKNLDCKWNVISPKGSGIRMTIEHLDNKEIFENGNGVCYDTLRIASVDSRGTPQYLHDEEELCAKSINKLTRKVFEIQNNGDGVAIAQISFQSDYVDQGTGFSIYFEALCNNTQSGESGTITSPNHPNKYPAYADCFTEIQAPHGSTIEIEFTNLEVETQNNCQTDYVDVIEGPPGLYGSKRTRYCKAVIGVLRISSYIATVEFVSDGTLAYSGFRATWKAVFSTTTTTTTSTTTTPTTTTTAAPSTTRTTTTLKTTTIEMKNCSYTNDSLLCQRWDSTKPHKPNYQPKDINHNYCRNPDNDARGYWCYTTDPDTRWGYCDIDNCVAPTTTTDETTTVTSEPTTISNEPTTITSEPTTITTSATTSDGGTSPLVAMFAGGSSAEKQASDGTITAAVLPWYAYIVIAAALVAFVIIVLIFVLRRRKKKKSALAINELNTTNTVVFSQYERDQYGDGARENTYVEIPFVGNMQESIALRDAADGGNDDTSGKGCFVRLPTNQTKNSSISSSDSIQLAKEAAQRRFSSDNRCEIASDANPYSLADEVAHNGQAPPLPEDRREHSLRGTTNVAMTEEANVYDVIDVSQLAGIKGNAFVRTSQPPPPSSERDTTKSKEDPEKKKPNEWKFLKKSTKSNLTSGAGFTNPSYQERDSSGDTVDDGNPFDTDEETVTDEPSTYHVPSVNPPRGSQVNGEETNLYNVPSVIPIRPETEKVEEVSKKKHHSSADSPYMLPKISMPNKVPAYTAMVPISPDLIDDGKKKAAFDNDLKLYSSPNPMSPTFEMVEDFTYDFPPDGRSAASSFSSKNESEGGQGDFSGQDSRNARDSGNASMAAFDSITAQDKNNEEYCSMGNFSPQEMRKEDGKGGAAKKPSQLYLSMKCIQPERRVSESSWQSTKHQTKNPRKSA